MSNDTVMELPEGFEEPSYGGGKYEFFRLKKDSTALYRILPAMKSLRKRRDFADFWYTHFYTGLDPKDPTKKKSHQILCVQEKDWRNGGVITKRCPLCEKRATYEAKKKAIEAKGAELKKGREEVKKALGPTLQWLKDHGCSGKWNMYAVDTKNNVGVLQINNRCMKDQLRPKIKKLVADGHTPCGVKGIFFEFTRQGDGFSTPDEVSVHMLEQADGSSKKHFHTLTKELGQQALEVLPDFEEEKARIKYPDAVLKELAACNDDPAEVNRILGIKMQDAEPDTDGSGSESVGDDAFVPSEGSSEAAPGGADIGDAFGDDSMPAAEASVEANQEDDADLQAQIAALQARAAAKKAAKPAAPAAKPPAKPKAPPKAEVPAEFDPATASDADLDAIFNAPAAE